MTSMPNAERCSILTANEGWFGSAAPEFQTAVLSRCGWSHVPAGQHLYRASDAHADVCGIIEGTVEIYSRYGAGDNPMLHLAHEGFWVGYGTVFGGALRLTVMARTDVFLARLSLRALQELLNERPEWWRFFALAAREYGDMAISAYADSLIPSGDRRCASTLLRVAGLGFPRRSRPERTAVPITQDELATLVNVSRSTLLHILRRFEDRGLVEQGYRELRIVDAAGLGRIAADGES